VIAKLIELMNILELLISLKAADLFPCSRRREVLCHAAPRGKHCGARVRERQVWFTIWRRKPTKPPYIAVATPVNPPRRRGQKNGISYEGKFLQVSLPHLPVCLKNANFTFYPMKELLKKVRKIEINTRRKVENTFAGEYHSAFRGQGLEFDEVRPYQDGDDIRSIDWNVTAKTGEAFIKKFKEEREKTLFVLFDVSGSENFGKEGENKLMVGTEIAAVIAFSAMKNSDKVGLTMFTDRVERFYAPKKGRKHILAMLNGLVQHKTASLRTGVKVAIDFANRVLRRRAIVIVISDFLDEGYETSLRHLARRHEVVMIRLYNPAETFKRPTGIIPVYDAERLKLVWFNTSHKGSRNAVEKKFNLVGERLQHLGVRNRVDFLSIDTTGDYMQQLEQFFRKRNSRRGK
jgi:Protein of unknown function DUF58